MKVPRIVHSGFKEALSTDLEMARQNDKDEGEGERETGRGKGRRKEGKTEGKRGR